MQVDLRCMGVMVEGVGQMSMTLLNSFCAPVMLAYRHRPVDALATETLQGVEDSGGETEGETGSTGAGRACTPASA